MPGFRASIIWAVVSCHGGQNSGREGKIIAGNKTKKK